MDIVSRRHRCGDEIRGQFRIPDRRFPPGRLRDWQAVQTISVTVDPRHFERLAANPARALAELIWNSLDADANKIDVVFDRNALSGVEAIRVVDDGHGMTESAAIEDFSRLGSSWKQHAERSKDEGRLLHGRNGQGRWAAYGLGEQIRWTSVAEVDGSLSRTEIVGRRSRPNEFEIDSAPADADAKVGTTVEVAPVADGVAALAEENARERLATAELALYLSMYPVALTVDGAKLDLAEMQERRHDEDLALPDGLGDAKLTIIEWRKPVERAIYLCDDDGFTLSEVPARFHAPGFNFTVYLRWSDFRERITDLSVAEFDPDLTTVIDSARAAARTYFNERTREHERETIERWKEEGVYPYEAEPEPEAEVDRAERALFDIVATTAAPMIDTADTRAKKLSLRLLRNAVTDPSALRRIIEDVPRSPGAQAGRARRPAGADHARRHDRGHQTGDEPARLAARPRGARLRAGATRRGQGAHSAPPDGCIRDVDLRRGVRAYRRRPVADDGAQAAHEGARTRRARA